MTPMTTEDFERMAFRINPENARSGQKLRRDRYLLPGLLVAALAAFTVVAVIVD